MPPKHDHGQFEAVLAGSSMEPTLLVGDRLTVEPRAGGPARRGELILFRTVGNEALVCHRVISVFALGIRTWYVHAGDAIPHRLAIVGDDRVLGLVREATRQGEAIALGEGQAPTLRARLRATAFAARHMGGALRRRSPRLMVSVSLELDLGSLGAPAERDVTVRELSREQLGPTLANAGLAVSSVEQVERVAPDRWRAFVAFDGSRAVHHSFVALPARGPLLFLSHTAPEERRRGIFRQVMAHIGSTLRREGHERLRSSCLRSNQASLQAHTRSGFRVRSTSYRPMVGAVDLRQWLRSVVMGARNE